MSNSAAAHATGRPERTQSTSSHPPLTVSRALPWDTKSSQANAGSPCRPQARWPSPMKHGAPADTRITTAGSPFLDQVRAVEDGERVLASADAHHEAERHVVGAPRGRPTRREDVPTPRDHASVLMAQQVEQGTGQRDAQQPLGLRDRLVRQRRLDDSLATVVPQGAPEIFKARHAGIVRARRGRSVSPAADWPQVRTRTRHGGTGLQHTRTAAFEPVVSPPRRANQHTGRAGQ